MVGGEFLFVGWAANGLSCLQHKREAWYGELSLLQQMRRDALRCAWVLVKSAVGYGLCDGVEVSCGRRWWWW